MRRAPVVVAVVLLGAVALAAAPATASGPSPVAAVAAGDGRGLWTAPAGRPGSDPPGAAPAAARRLGLDRAGMAELLARAPREGSAAARTSALTVALPAPDGGFAEFDLVESPVMAPALAAAHPQIRTYAGTSEDGAASIRADLTPVGFHASVRGPAGTWYIDPAGRDHVSYHASDRDDPVARVADEVLAASRDTGAVPPTREGRSGGGEVVLRTYRLALVSDPTYATAVGPANVTAAKVTLVNRVTQIYRDDLAIRLVLVDDNDKLNLDTDALATAPNGPCGGSACFSPGDLASCTSTGLNANQAAVDRAVGSDNYDVGHLILGTDGGGLASLAVVGTSGLKARGCTGLPDPHGDGFAVDYVAHELGHQFGANHTFNGITGACGGGNREGPTSVEPGSGSSVMAYAGICGSDDLQSHSDPYFSLASQDEITAFVDGTATAGGTPTATGNRSPVVTGAGDHVIPVRTPFALTGSATDADGDPLVYLWEQDDPGVSGTTLATQSRTNGPLFRQFGTAATVSYDGSLQTPSPGLNAAGGGPTRVFPDIAQILSGATNAATGTCPSATVECLSELLPTSAYIGTGDRRLHFRLTARDRDAAGGGVGTAESVLTVDPEAGPLLVTSDASPASLPGGKAREVTWSVNGTDGPALAPQVSIALSTDGGLTYPQTLVAATPNDGAATVTLPNPLATVNGLVRFRVAAVGNVFFDINDAGLTLTRTTEAVADTASALSRIGGSPTTSIPVLSNDIGHGLHAEVITGPAHGTASVAGDGTIGYTPAPGVTGADSFTYRVIDGLGTQSPPVTVALTVTAELAVTAPSGSVVVGQPTPALDPAYAGFVAGDDVTTLSQPATCGSARTAGDAPGDYAVTCTAPIAPPHYTVTRADGVLHVGRAGTATVVTLAGGSARAAVSVTAPGAGTPTGTVSFATGGAPLGSVALGPDGTASLPVDLPSAGTTVSATYSGDARFTASTGSATSAGSPESPDPTGSPDPSGSPGSADSPDPTGSPVSADPGGSTGTTERRDPVVTAAVTGTPNAAGWFRRSPVVTFTCTTGSAPLVTGCPAPITVPDGRDREVAVTVRATDGGSASVTVSGLDVDTVAPRVTVRGVRPGGVPRVREGQRLRCVTADALSGPAARCRARVTRPGADPITEPVRGRFRAVGRDVAGNRTVIRGRVVIVAR